ncbi:hypothetical protein [Georgenia subflava]|uniref:Uncharacterized protein n=1 Tax=Georgenia subflava TaxID=1622177 RepID=A0A6N7EF63_9MICO|nr:hypothetical protein [Georgenia subflava]MPV36749.1 hypothetical protein [Georgenia subflava]
MPRSPAPFRRTAGRVAGILTVALLALGLAACDDTTTQDGSTTALEDRLASIPDVEDARVRLQTGGDGYVSLQLGLTPGARAGQVTPVVQATKAAVEASEHVDTELIVYIDWVDGERSYEMGMMGQVRLLGALGNEVPAMAELMQHDFGSTRVWVDEYGEDGAQYGRDIDVTVTPGTPDRALVRIFHALHAQLPDQQQSTRFDISYHDYSADGPRDGRRVGIDARAPAPVVAAVDRIMRSPEPRGWDGATDLSVSTGGYGADPADWYVSVHARLTPADLADAPEDELADRAGDDVVTAAAEHLAEALVMDGPEAMLDVTLASAEGHADVGGFYSASCAEAWEDESGRSRQLWEAWVGAGGQPTQDGATATECPDA